MTTKLITTLLLFFVTIHGKFIEHRIVGGGDALNGEFPYLVSIQVRGVHDCGGAILDQYWILTAAHCLTKLPKKMTVIAGTNNLNQNGVVYNVNKLIPHKKFSSLTGKNDIGLLKVVEPIKFGEKIYPISLPKMDVKVGDVLTLAGWGQTEKTRPSNNLQKINLKTISNIKCFLKMQPKFFGFIWRTNICTLNRKGQGACYGDSGSPLVSRGEIKGIISWSEPCARGKPDVSTRVFDYINWINSNKN